MSDQVPVYQEDTIPLLVEVKRGLVTVSQGEIDSPKNEHDARADFIELTKANLGWPS